MLWWPLPLHPHFSCRKMFKPPCNASSRYIIMIDGVCYYTGRRMCINSKYLPVQSQQDKLKKKLWNMFKVNISEARSSLFTLNVFHTFFQFLSCWVWTSICLQGFPKILRNPHLGNPGLPGSSCQFENSNILTR